MHTAWIVIVNGKTLCTMAGKPKTYEQALVYARFHWPHADVEPR